MHRRDFLAYAAAAGAALSGCGVARRVAHLLDAYASQDITVDGVLKQLWRFPQREHNGTLSWTSAYDYYSPPGPWFMIEYNTRFEGVQSLLHEQVDALIDPSRTKCHPKPAALWAPQLVVTRDTKRYGRRVAWAGFDGGYLAGHVDENDRFVRCTGITQKAGWVRYSFPGTDKRNFEYVFAMYKGLPDLKLDIVRVAEIGTNNIEEGPPTERDHEIFFSTLRAFLEKDPKNYAEHL